MGHHSEAFIGIDTAKLRNAVAVAEAGRKGEMRYLGEVDTSETATRKLVAELAAKYRKLTFCYEAGPTGYSLQRLIDSLGHTCIVVAPSLVPISALDALGTLGPSAMELLVAALKDERMRIQVVNVLGKLGKPALSPVLELYQRETDMGVRQACLWVFGHLEDEIAVDVLMVALRKDNVLCYTAAHALSKAGAPDAAKKYISFLKEIEGEQMLTMLKRLCDAYIAQDKTNIAGLEIPARVIGQELCYRGGVAEMQHFLSKLGEYSAAEKIHWLWDGIGDWSSKKEGVIGDLGKDKGSEGTGMGSELIRRKYIRPTGEVGLMCLPFKPISLGEVIYL